MSVNGRILIDGYELTGCHGVNPEEKVEPQRFVFSAQLDFDLTEAAETDDVDKTVSYAAVCKVIKAFFGESSRDLVETLALGAARRIMLAFPRLVRAAVTVAKPDAPMKGKFDSVGVTAEVKRSVAYVGMGSSLGDRHAYLDKAKELIREDPLVLSVRESARTETAPYGGAAKNAFINSALRVETLHTPEGLLGLLMRVERECGRTREVHWGDRTLDLDLLLFGDEVRSEDDLILPHPEMTRREFVLAPLADIAPHAVHPLCGKRVSELLSELLPERRG